MYGFLCNRRTTKHSSGFYFEYRTWSRRRYSDEHSSSTINRRWNNSKYVYVTCHCKYSSKLDIFTISCQSNKECIYNDALDDITQAWDNCSAEKLLQYACVVLYTYIHLIKFTWETETKTIRLLAWLSRYSLVLLSSNRWSSATLLITQWIPAWWSVTTWLLGTAYRHRRIGNDLWRNRFSPSIPAK